MPNRRLPIAIALALVVAAAGPALASNFNIAYTEVGDCEAAGTHSYYAPDNDRFRFSTYEYVGDCYLVKVQAHYWTDAPPYGWVLSPVYQSSTSALRTVYNAPVHDYSRHSVCDPGCFVFDLQ